MSNYVLADDDLPEVTQARLRHFVFTLNNYSAEEEEAVKSFDCSYMVYGHEIGKKRHVPHLQGYIELAKQMSFSTIKAKFPRMWIQSRRGTPQQASDYCKKDADFFEKGEISRQGKRTDLDAFVDGVIAKRPCREELFRSKQYMIHPRFTMEVVDYFHPPQPVAVLDNYWFHGPTGSGKSTRALKLYPDHYLKDINKWWDGYHDEETVIIEEWSPESYMLLQHLKRWADHHVFRAEIKGGCRVIRPRRIVVTSNYTIEECAPRQQDLLPLLRRFQQVLVE